MSISATSGFAYLLTDSNKSIVFQYLLSEASVDGADHSQPCGTGACVVQFGSRWTNIDTVVLISNGIVFAFQGLFLICFGSMADYGPLKKWILIFWTIVCWATQFAFLGLQNYSQYKAAIGVYIVTCGLSFSFLPLVGNDFAIDYTSLN